MQLISVSLLYFGGLALCWFGLPYAQRWLDSLDERGVPGKWRTPGLIPVSRAFIVFGFVIGVIAISVNAWN